MRGAAWGPDGTIWYTPNLRSALWRVFSEGGEPAAATTLDAGRGEISHRWPELLPGRKALLFTVKTADISYDEARIDAVDLGTGRRRTVLEGGYHARYAPSGHLVFFRGGSLMAAPFDPERLLVTGPTTQASDGILADPSSGSAQFDFSADGLLAYIPGKARFPERHLVWVDRRGGAELIPAPLRAYDAVRVSADGRQLALGIGAANDDIWILDFGSGALTRLTHGGGNHKGPSGPRTEGASHSPPRGGTLERVLAAREWRGRGGTPHERSGSPGPLLVLARRPLDGVRAGEPEDERRHLAAVARRRASSAAPPGDVL